jgi:hypothetical protein
MLFLLRFASPSPFFFPHVQAIVCLQAWLDPINLPQGEDMLCGICHNPLQFLLQVSWKK